MKSAPGVTARESTTTRAKRTPRVYEPEEDEEYPIGGQRYEEPAEDASPEAALDKKEDE